MSLTANNLVRGSGKSTIFIPQGGPGGDGGNGKSGQSHLDQIPGILPDAKSVVQNGVQV